MRNQFHRSRATKFISSTRMPTYESSFFHKHQELSYIQSQWNERIKDFLSLKRTVRATRFLRQFIHGIRESEHEWYSQSNSRRLSFQYGNKNIE